MLARLQRSRAAAPRARPARPERARTPCSASREAAPAPGPVASAWAVSPAKSAATSASASSRRSPCSALYCWAFLAWRSSEPSWRAHLVHHVAHADEVLAGAVELALGLVALLLVAGDAGRLLDEHPPLVRLGGQDVVELVLVHHRVRARVGAGAGEEVEDVAQARRLLVEEVLALTRAVEAARDARSRSTAPTACRRWRRSARPRPGRSACGAPVPWKIRSSMRWPRSDLRALLAERPAHGLADVGLAAAVGTRRCP